jgi:hypothetical protein
MTICGLIEQVLLMRHSSGLGWPGTSNSVIHHPVKQVSPVQHPLQLHPMPSFSEADWRLGHFGKII